jgi:hypothetical protein
MTILSARLVPTAFFFPVRFQCIQMLLELSEKTRQFIPVVPYLLEVWIHIGVCLVKEHSLTPGLLYGL